MYDVTENRVKTTSDGDEDIKSDHIVPGNVAQKSDDEAEKSEGTSATDDGEPKSEKLEGEPEKPTPALIDDDEKPTSGVDHQPRADDISPSDCGLVAPSQVLERLEDKPGKSEAAAKDKEDEPKSEVSGERSGDETSLPDSERDAPAWALERLEEEPEKPEPVMTDDDDEWISDVGGQPGADEISSPDSGLVAPAQVVERLEDEPGKSEAAVKDKDDEPKSEVIGKRSGDEISSPDSERDSPARVLERLEEEPEKPELAMTDDDDEWTSDIGSQPCADETSLPDSELIDPSQVPERIEDKEETSTSAFTTSELGEEIILDEDQKNKVRYSEEIFEDPYPPYLAHEEDAYDAIILVLPIDPRSPIEGLRPVKFNVQPQEMDPQKVCSELAAHDSITERAVASDNKLPLAQIGADHALDSETSTEKLPDVGVHEDHQGTFVVPSPIDELHPEDPAHGEPVFSQFSTETLQDDINVNESSSCADDLSGVLDGPAEQSVRQGVVSAMTVETAELFELFQMNATSDIHEALNTSETCCNALTSIRDPSSLGQCTVAMTDTDDRDNLIPCCPLKLDDNCLNSERNSVEPKGSGDSGAEVENFESKLPSKDGQLTSGHLESVDDDYRTHLSPSEHFVSPANTTSNPRHLSISKHDPPPPLVHFASINRPSEEARMWSMEVSPLHSVSDLSLVLEDAGNARLCTDVPRGGRSPNLAPDIPRELTGHLPGGESGDPYRLDLHAILNEKRVGSSDDSEEKPKDADTTIENQEPDEAQEAEPGLEDTSDISVALIPDMELSTEESDRDWRKVALSAEWSETLPVSLPCRQIEDPVDHQEPFIVEKGGDNDGLDWGALRRSASPQPGQLEFSESRGSTLDGDQPSECLSGEEDAGFDGPETEPGNANVGTEAASDMELGDDNVPASADEPVIEQPASPPETPIVEGGDSGIDYPQTPGNDGEKPALYEDSSSEVEPRPVSFIRESTHSSTDYIKVAEEKLGKMAKSTPEIKRCFAENAPTLKTRTVMTLEQQFESSSADFTELSIPGANSDDYSKNTNIISDEELTTDRDEVQEPVKLEDLTDDEKVAENSDDSSEAGYQSCESPPRWSTPSPTEHHSSASDRGHFSRSGSSEVLSIPSQHDDSPKSDRTSRSDGVDIYDTISEDDEGERIRPMRIDIAPPLFDIFENTDIPGGATEDADWPVLDKKMKDTEMFEDEEISPSRTEPVETPPWMKLKKPVILVAEEKLGSISKGSEITKRKIKCTSMETRCYKLGCETAYLQSVDFETAAQQMRSLLKPAEITSDEFILSNVSRKEDDDSRLIVAEEKLGPQPACLAPPVRYVRHQNWFQPVHVSYAEALNLKLSSAHFGEISCFEANEEKAVKLLDYSNVDSKKRKRNKKRQRASFTSSKAGLSLSDHNDVRASDLNDITFESTSSEIPPVSTVLGEPSSLKRSLSEVSESPTLTPQDFNDDSIDTDGYLSLDADQRSIADIGSSYHSLSIDDARITAFLDPTPPELLDHSVRREIGGIFIDDDLFSNTLLPCPIGEGEANICSSSAVAVSESRWKRRRRLFAALAAIVLLALMLLLLRWGCVGAWSCVRADWFLKLDHLGKPLV